MNFEELKSYLYQLRAFGSRLGLERMKRLCAELGHPEEAFTSIHVAGTNGKGSVCALVESALRHCGYRTGLYSSPHLVYLGERIQIDREPIAPEALARLVSHLKPVAEKIEKEAPDQAPTFFEFMTAAAFEYFAQKKVDVAVIETGLGGRFDSTNVLTPALTAITSIALDHTEYLGDSLVKIAFEKGGIFKPGVPVVLGQLRPSAEKELRRIAREKKTGAVKNIVRRFGNDSQKWPRSALKGAYQRKNAATALLILESLKTRFPKLNDGGIAKGFQSVRWDGRWQEFLLQDKRTLILEGAHNPEAAQLLQQELSALRKKGKRIAAVMGACGLSRAHAVLEALAAHADSITLVKVAQPRGCTVEQLGEILKKLNYRGQVAHADVSALFPRPAAAAFGAATDTLLVTGSLYLVGEVLERLRPRASDARGELGFHDLI